ncbi:MAG TPA: hypothetical protein PKZ54_11075, partial [Syntrophorhabdaceae bacterium]|nr:hypothetical protein [Syntrophorhabdaceae bacterium]
MKKFLFSCVVCLFFFVLVSVTTASYAQDKIQIKISNWFSVGTGQDKLLKEWGEDLEKRTNG